MSKSPSMRLFNGHLKMSPESLKKVFLIQLSNIYCIKTYLVANLPLIVVSASFNDLKNAIIEGLDDIKLQILRMDIIYKLIGETYHPRQCMGVRALTIEAFKITYTADNTNLEKDLLLIYHLCTLESIEIACFKALGDLACSMPLAEMSLLLKQNLDLSRDSKELYELIAREYVN